ncbi:MAG: ligase-associated DNA damage response endonuclease PdeM [Bacteroidota bacterium]|nr:ligase-associated DNA damage response endonuclease PdeM [Bacteroidota bacterium]
MQIEIKDTPIELLSEKAIFIPGTKTLVIADLHLGKASHFRKHGISIPMESAEKDYLRLKQLIDQVRPPRVLLLGDLFHSEHNNEWKWFCDFVNGYKEVEFILVMGNHDILDKKHYKEVCLTLVDEELIESELIFSHKPMKKVPEGKFNLAGHLHPGYKVRGKGRQSILLPCFYKTIDQMILPAFGSLTGLALMNDKGKKSEVYVIANDKVIKM